METNNAVFLTSASKYQECPNLSIPIFAFIWRSNVWKSSLINMLTWIKWLARASNKPGKTQLINYFIIDESWVLVDLPWYWYAKVWVQKKIWWMDELQKYFTKTKWLKNIFVLLDWSIWIQNIDMEFIQTLFEVWLSFDLVVTKIDKSNQKNLAIFFQNLQKELLKRNINDINVFPVSNTKKIWKNEILDYIKKLIIKNDIAL